MSTRCLFLFSGLLTAAQPVHSHDIYSQLLDGFGRPCCNDYDCQPAEYRFTGQGVQMFIDKKWIDVPEETIQYRSLAGDTGRTGGGHWCGLEMAELGERGQTVLITRCAILPSQSASNSHVVH